MNQFHTPKINVTQHNHMRHWIWVSWNRILQSVGEYNVRQRNRKVAICSLPDIVQKMWWNCISQDICNVTHFLLAMGEDVMRLSHSNAQCDLLAVHWKRCNKTVTTMHNVAHRLLVKGRDCLLQNVWCHSLAVGHIKGCDETAFYKVCKITYLLLVIGKHMMRLHFTECVMSLTPCWS